jgi:hypothetical protein
MTDTAVHPGQAAADDRIEEEALATGETGSVSFAELVRIHYEWERAFRGGRPDAELEAEFRAKLVEFQECEGTVLHAYWSRRRPSAVALTARAHRRFRRWRLNGWKLQRGRFREDVDDRTDPDAVIQLHRATDWLAREAPIADLLHHCDTLAIRVGEVLRGTSERIAMEWIFAVQSHLLGFIERTNGKATPEQMKAITRLRPGARVLADRLVQRPVPRRLRDVLRLLRRRRDRRDRERHVPHGYRKQVPRRLRGRPPDRAASGSVSSVHRAVFGVSVYFLISSGLPQVSLPADEQAFFYYGTVAFLAGFFERRTMVTLGTAEQTLQRSLGLTPKDDDEGARFPDLTINGDPLGPGETSRTVVTRHVERSEPS